LVQNKILVLNVKEKKMKLKGVLHKIAWIDLTQKEISFEEPPDSVYSDYLGGYGVGAYYLFTRQRPGADPLGPENILGFLPGPLTGTQAIGETVLLLLQSRRKQAAGVMRTAEEGLAPHLSRRGLMRSLLPEFQKRRFMSLSKKVRLRSVRRTFYGGLV
jgi:hypothetical protein